MFTKYPWGIERDEMRVLIFKIKFLKKLFENYRFRKQLKKLDAEEV